jgi:diguanylate cyclase (GGDEF)-like protein
MNRDTLDKILRCPELPSLPAAAVRVIELTSDPNVSLDELGSVIQNDQGLAAKVLRTVNSSFYGLRQRCATIQKALVMLGLGPVKSLALGFSLVSSIGQKRDEDFDYVAYWRRGLFSAVASKFVAESAMSKIGDEAFLGGLLQDVGVMAMYKALGADYAAALKATEGDHRRLVRIELERFELQHPDVGALLAQRWKLPEQLVMPVKYHERPTAAPIEGEEIVQCVAVGNLVHDVLTDADPAPAMRRLYERCDQWFGLTGERVDALVRRSAEATRQMSSLFRLDTGAFADADEVLQRARAQADRLVQTPAAPQAGRVESLLIDSARTDPMTGAVSRAAFPEAVRLAVTAAHTASTHIGLLMVRADGLRELVDRGDATGDDAALALATLLAEGVGLEAVCRLGPDLFAVIIAGADDPAVQSASARVRQRWNSVRPAGHELALSVGAGSRPPGASVASTAQTLIDAASRSLTAARARAA